MSQISFPQCAIKRVSTSDFYTSHHPIPLKGSYSEGNNSHILLRPCKNTSRAPSAVGTGGRRRIHRDEIDRKEVGDRTEGRLLEDGQGPPCCLSPCCLLKSGAHLVSPREPIIGPHSGAVEHRESLEEACLRGA